MSLRGKRKYTLGLVFMALSTLIAVMRPEHAALIIGAIGGGLFGVIYGNIQEHRASAGPQS